MLKFSVLGAVFKPLGGNPELDLWVCNCLSADMGWKSHKGSTLWDQLVKFWPNTNLRVGTFGTWVWTHNHFFSRLQTCRILNKQAFKIRKEADLNVNLNFKGI